MKRRTNRIVLSSCWEQLRTGKAWQRLSMTLLVAVMTMTAQTARAAEIVDFGAYGDHLTYTVTEYGVITISGTGEIPESFIHSIIDVGFITSIIVEDGVTSIGYAAFMDCPNLKFVTIGNDVTSIGSGAFYNCPNLVSVTFGSGVTSIEGGVFYDCAKLTSIYVMATTPPALDFNSFFNNPDVSGIRIYVPADSKENYKNVWSTYGGLISAIIASAKYKDEDPNNPSVDEINWFLCEDGRMLVNGHGKMPNSPWKDFLPIYDPPVTSIEIYGGVTSVGESAFLNCWDLTSVTIDNVVESIGQNAFSGCTNENLNITIPASVRSIDYHAFDGVAKVTATLSDAYDNASLLAALSDVKTADLTFKRSFNTSSNGIGKASTICLPYDFAKPDKSTVGTFATFGGVTQSGGEYIVTMNEVSNETTTLTAGTPYMFQPATGNEVTFQNTAYTVPNGGLTAASSATNSGWQFKGTYTIKYWPSGQTRLYGFAGKDFILSNDTQIDADDIGTFCRFNYGTCDAFRCYLMAPESSGSARGVSKANSLPDMLKVRLVKADGTTTAIGTLDTRMGEIEFGDDWYDLNGRRLEGQPTQKGVYINNGRKIIKN